jgi:tetratricopeptide (TPR) repeat protein
MKYLLFILLPFTVFILSSCNSTALRKDTTVTLNNTLLNNDYFSINQQSEYIAIESPQQIFTLDANIKKMVATTLLPVKDKKKRAIALLKHIFNSNKVALAYQSDANLTANETYYSKQANCLSLTIMAYALAKEAQLAVRFQTVNVPEFWIRNGRYNMLTGHVNLLVLLNDIPNKSNVYSTKNLQIDFDPYIAKKQFSRQLIDKKTVIAMYYNNKAAQAIVAKHYQQAYAYLKSALKTKPNFSTGWGNLALLYKLNNLHQFARDTYLYALELNPNNDTALANYALLLPILGETDKALQIQKLLKRKRQKNPYYHALLADEANYNG